MKRAKFWLIAGGYLALFGVAGFLLLRPSPYAGEVSWIPAWLAQWADSNANVRTFVLTTGICFMAGLLGASILDRRLRRVIIAGLLLVLFEVAQIWIPARSFVWADMGWTAIGTAGVALLFTILDRFISRRHRKDFRNENTV